LLWLRNYDLTDVKDAFDAEGNIKPMTDNMIWFTLWVNMGEITEENAEEFFVRLQLNFHMTKLTEMKVTLQDVKDHIGLKTNVPEKTWNEFIKKEVKMFCQKHNFKPGRKPKKKAKSSV